jgi:hypothetical protein
MFRLFFWLWRLPPLRLSACKFGYWLSCGVMLMTTHAIRSHWHNEEHKAIRLVINEAH